MTTSRYIIRITASSTAQPLASPLSSERSPTALATTFFIHHCLCVRAQVFNGLDGHSSGSTTRHPNCHPPCLERAIVPILVPNVVVTGARWYPNCVSPRNAIRHGEFWKSQELDSRSPTITVSIHHLPQPTSHSPPPCHSFSHVAVTPLSFHQGQIVTP